MGVSTGAIEAGRGAVVLVVDDSPLMRGLQAAAEKVEGFAKGIAAMGGMFKGLGAGLGAVVDSVTATFRETVAEIRRANQVTGIGAETLSEMGYAAQQLGGDLETVTHGMWHLGHFIQEVRNGSQSAMQTLQELGVTQDEVLRGG